MCNVKMSSRNTRDSHELTIAAINELEDVGMKVRLKVVLALTEVNTDLYDLKLFDGIPLELMPRLLELVQQELVSHLYFECLWQLSLADEIHFAIRDTMDLAKASCQTATAKSESTSTTIVIDFGDE